jgi:hypothetical protein
MLKGWFMLANLTGLHAEELLWAGSEDKLNAFMQIKNCIVKFASGEKNKLEFWWSKF